MFVYELSHSFVKGFFWKMVVQGTALVLFADISTGRLICLLPLVGKLLSWLLNYALTKMKNTKTQVASIMTNVDRIVYI